MKYLQTHTHAYLEETSIKPRESVGIVNDGKKERACEKDGFSDLK